MALNLHMCFLHTCSTHLWPPDKKTRFQLFFQLVELRQELTRFELKRAEIREGCTRGAPLGSRGLRTKIFVGFGSVVSAPIANN